MPDLE
jgi:dynein heavy chain